MPVQPELLRSKPWESLILALAVSAVRRVLESAAERINACGLYRAEVVAASTARATFRVRFETGRTVISLSGTCSAPLMRGSLFTLMQNGSTVISRYVTVC